MISGPATRPARGGRLVAVLLLLVVLGIVAWAGWALMFRKSNTSGRFGGMPMTTVGVAKVEARDIPVQIEALGTVTPLATVTVRPQVSGVIQRMLFTEGDMVKQGQLLAVIDPRPYQLALDQAEGTLKSSQAELANAQAQLERYRTLIQQDSIAQQDVDSQAATVRQLEGTVATNRAAVGTAKLNVEYTQITAPVSGRVGLRVVDVGNYIAAGDSSGLVVLTQLIPIDVVFTVPQDRIAEISSLLRDGAKLGAVALDRTRTAELAQGSFLTLDNQVSTETGTIKAKARFANADAALFPNQFVNLRMTLRTIQQVPTVPVSALRNGTDGDYVWVLADDRTVQQRSVKRGVTLDTSVQITEGVQIGEQVVTEGGDRLRDGAHVNLPGDQPQAMARPAGGPNGERPRGNRPPAP